MDLHACIMNMMKLFTCNSFGMSNDIKWSKSSSDVDCISCCEHIVVT